MWRRVLSIAVLVLGGSFIPALAVEGRIPVFQPTTITQPGHYILTQSISSTAVTLIQISASNVTLDLNGHTVTSTTPSTSGVGVINIAGSSTDITIRNGRISGGVVGIRFFTTTVLARLRAENVEIVSPAVHGIEIYGAEAVDVISCRVLDAGLGQGISVSNVSGTFSGRFLNNTVEGVGQAGFMLRGLDAGEIRGNVIRNYGVSTFGYGITLGQGNNPLPPGGGNLIEGNTIRGGGSDDVGIEIAAFFPTGLSERNMILRNTITSGGAVGINVITSGNLVSGNIVSGGSGHGIYLQLGNNNLVEDNHVQGNSGCGINFGNAGSHAYRNNMLRGNTGGAVCGSANTDAGGNIL